MTLYWCQQIKPAGKIIMRTFLSPFRRELPEWRINRVSWAAPHLKQCCIQGNVCDRCIKGYVSYVCVRVNITRLSTELNYLLIYIYILHRFRKNGLPWKKRLVKVTKALKNKHNDYFCSFKKYRRLGGLFWPTCSVYWTRRHLLRYRRPCVTTSLLLFLLIFSLVILSLSKHYQHMVNARAICL